MANVNSISSRIFWRVHRFIIQPMSLVVQCALLAEL